MDAVAEEAEAVDAKATAEARGGGEDTAAGADHGSGDGGS